MLGFQAGATIPTSCPCFEGIFSCRLSVLEKAEHANSHLLSDSRNCSPVRSEERTRHGYWLLFALHDRSDFEEKGFILAPDVREIAAHHGRQFMAAGACDTGFSHPRDWEAETAG